VAGFLQKRSVSHTLLRFASWVSTGISLRVRNRLFSRGLTRTEKK
jgi:hypothetical protein